jgi:alkanesulfonate monooxygenase SsuD/methylene tetrahydromethanopterin reductase-like flavin-dependent oxidoreductase (luciferase family)
MEVPGVTVYVDPPRPAPTLDRLQPGWPLLTCCGSVTELHEFARRIGVGPGWFSPSPEPSYALTEDARSRAVAAGAHVREPVPC